MSKKREMSSNRRFSPRKGRGNQARSMDKRRKYKMVGVLNLLCELSAAFRYSDGVLRVGSPVTFMATSAQTNLRYAWNCGVGYHAEASTVYHTFADTLGSDVDDSSRYRVALHVTDPRTHEQSWSTQYLILDRRARKTDTSRRSSGARVDIKKCDVPKDGPTRSRS